MVCWKNRNRSSFSCSASFLECRSYHHDLCPESVPSLTPCEISHPGSEVSVWQRQPPHPQTTYRVGYWWRLSFTNELSGEDCSCQPLNEALSGIESNFRTVTPSAFSAMPDWWSAIAMWHAWFPTVVVIRNFASALSRSSLGTAKDLRDMSNFSFMVF